MAACGTVGDWSGKTNLDVGTIMLSAHRPLGRRRSGPMSQLNAWGEISVFKYQFHLIQIPAFLAACGSGITHWASWHVLGRPKGEFGAFKSLFFLPHKKKWTACSELFLPFSDDFGSK